MDFFIGCFFGLCFAIEVPEGYKFIRAQAEHIKVAGQSEYNFLGINVTYLYFNILWRLPPWLGWLPIWVNDSLHFLLNDWMPMEFWDEDIQENRTRPLVLQITRIISATMLFFIEFIREILIGGVKTVVTFTSWDWIDAKSMGRTAWATLDHRYSRSSYIRLQTEWERSSHICWRNYDLYFRILVNGNLQCKHSLLYW